MKTLEELRADFWVYHPEFKQDARIYIFAGNLIRKSQNDYNATIRSTWVDFVDMMERNGEISTELAQEATL